MKEQISILVCQHLTCRKQGAIKVLAAFKSLENYRICAQGCGCLGRCGNGPNVLIMPAQICYDRVKERDVSKIITQVESDDTIEFS
jgi:(2Fe-2S) ferredoxin